jgi:hypothetical protein
MPQTTITDRSTNTREVVLALQALLVSQLADLFTEETVVITDPDSWDSGQTPENLIATSFITLCPGDSDFPDDVQVGGGANTVEELGTLELYIFSDARLDQTGVFPAAVYDPNEGLFELKRRVLRALCQADPTGDNTKLLVSQLIPIRSCTKPTKNSSGVHFLRLVFGTSFFWDLS